MKFVFTTLLFSFFLLLNQIYTQNNALNFDGANDYVKLGSSNLPAFNTYTIEYFVKNNGTDMEYDRILGMSGFFFEISKNGTGLIKIYYPSCGWVSTGHTLVLNTWTHHAWTYDGISTKLYVNGALAFTASCSLVIPSSSWYLGSQYFLGENGKITIDEFRIWNYARTLGDIQANMNLELSSGTGLVASYHFNQGVTGGNNSGVTTLNDALGNNNGTLNGFALTGSTSNWVDGASSIVLPVELLIFEGKNTEGGNLLTWLTASETQNKGFDIERSTDGVSFEKIGFVLGNGTTIQKQDYFFKDESFEGVVYYRLKQLDFDGRFEYSKIISIDGKGKTVVLSVFPNPSNGLFNIFGVDDSDTESYTLMNSVGQAVSIKVQNDGQVDMSVYPSGVYYLRVSSSGHVIKLVKE
jgi:hypothetical protein